MIINDELFCSFVQIESYLYECIKCGVRLTVEDQIENPPLIPCSAPIANYSASGIKSFMADYVNNEDLCNEKEIDRRHNICSGCEFFSSNSCIKCGCSLSRDKIYMNKLAIKNQSCPIDKW